MLAKEISFACFALVLHLYLFFFFLLNSLAFTDHAFASLLEIVDMYLDTNSFYLFVFRSVMIFFSCSVWFIKFHKISFPS